MRYGLSYMGSKNDLAERIVKILPAADTLVDLFAGGCAVAHAALLSGKWRRIIANDITDAPQLFLDAIHGKYRNYDRWISREEFEMFNDSDPFVRICWSFGNKGETYIYARELEPYKKALYEMLFEPDVYERYLKYRKVIRELNKIAPFVRPVMSRMTPAEQSLFYESAQMQARRLSNPEQLYSLENIQTLESIQHLNTLNNLQNLERLQSLDNPEMSQNLDQLEISQKDYREVEIPEGAIVFCDPPYANTAPYKGIPPFDYDTFRDWCKTQTTPVFISEYSMPEDFHLIAEWHRSCSMNADGNKDSIERLYANDAATALIPSFMRDRRAFTQMELDLN